MILLGKFIDLTGLKFGKFTVIKKHGKDDNGYILWDCACDCGNPDIIVVRGNSLKSGGSQSCGCLKLEVIKERGKSNRKYEFCTLDGCNDKHYAKGLCKKHYRENSRYGHILTDDEKGQNKVALKNKMTQIRTQNSVCEFCGNKGFLHKEFKMILCGKHCTQMQRHGKIMERTRTDINEYIFYEDYAEIILYNRKNLEVARAMISLDKVELCQKYKWSLGGYGYASNKKN